MSSIASPSAREDKGRRRRRWSLKRRRDGQGMREETTRGDIVVIRMRGQGRVRADLPLLVSRATSWVEVPREKNQHPHESFLTVRYSVDLAGSQISWSANAWRYWVLQQAACQGFPSQTNALETQVAREDEKSAFRPWKRVGARRGSRGIDAEKREHYSITLDEHNGVALDGEEEQLDAGRHTAAAR